MSDRSLPSPGDEDDQFAAEYALGVLGAADHRRAELRAEREPEFADRVQAWQNRLAPLLEEIKPVAPPQRVWSRIEAVIGEHPSARHSPKAPASMSSQTLRGLAFWRWVSFGSMAVAAASVAAAIIVTRPTTPLPIQLASLSSASGQPSFTALIDHNHSQATLIPQAKWQVPGRVPELWWVPKSGPTVSLGVFDPAQPHKVSVPREILTSVGAGQTLAISDEPPGGSPTGQATGSVIATGTLKPL